MLSHVAFASFRLCRNYGRYPELFKMRKQNLLLYPPELATNFVAEQEGFKAVAYKCPAGVWTIGFGHTKDVHKGDSITRGEAYRLLDNDLKRYQEDLAALIKVDVTENQFIALMSFIYNFGITKCRTYTLFKKINAGDEHGIREWWPKYCNPGSSFEKGLRDRRLRELELFFKN